jgi:hypothetical protein
MQDQEELEAMCAPPPKDPPDTHAGPNGAAPPHAPASSSSAHAAPSAFSPRGAAGDATPAAGATPRDPPGPAPEAAAAAAAAAADDDPGANPRPAWGMSHLMAITDGATAAARFAGGGSDDMPTVVSAGPAVARGGRGRWEVRFDKKGAGVTKVWFDQGGLAAGRCLTRIRLEFDRWVRLDTQGQNLAIRAGFDLNLTIF